MLSHPASIFQPHYATGLIIAAALFLLALCAIYDIAFRLIPDPLCINLAVLAIVLHLVRHDLPYAFLAALIVFALAFIAWTRHWLGGGDVKLLAAASLLAGPHATLPMVVLMGAAGGVLAIAYLSFSFLPPTSPSAPPRFVLLRILRIERRAHAAPAFYPVWCRHRHGHGFVHLRGAAVIVRLALFITMALGLAGFGLVAWTATRPPHPVIAAAPPPARETVLVASKTLQAGTLLHPDALTSASILVSAAPPGATRDTQQNAGDLVGAMLRRSLVKGEPLLQADALRPGDHGFLAAVLEPGMRAISIGVDAVSGTAGLIWPGDRVDVILTHGNNQNGNGVTATRVMQNARVIAIDQHLVEGITANSATTQPQARTVTLEVSGIDAERVAVAQHLGALALDVRSAQGGAGIIDATDPVNATVQASDILPGQTTLPTAAQATVIHIWSGTDDGKEFHF